MHFRIITKPGCPYCDQAKTLMTMKGHSYSEDVRDTPALIESFKAAGYRSFPQIFDGERRIGGFDQLKGYLAKGVNGIFELEDEF